MSNGRGNEQALAELPAHLHRPEHRYVGGAFSFAAAAVEGLEDLDGVGFELVVGGEGVVEADDALRLSRGDGADRFQAQLLFEAHKQRPLGDTEDLLSFEFQRLNACSKRIAAFEQDLEEEVVGCAVRADVLDVKLELFRDRLRILGNVCVPRSKFDSASLKTRKPRSCFLPAARSSLLASSSSSFLMTRRTRSLVMSAIVV